MRGDEKKALFAAESRNGVPLYLPFAGLEGIIAGFTTRHGGCSEGPYATLNLGLHVGDEPRRVLANRATLGETLGYDPEKAVCAAQVHGTRVAVVGKKEAGNGAMAVDDALPGIDGLVTTAPGLPLLAFFADCVPLFLYDPVRRAAALIHAGWRGTAGHIAETAVKVMKEECGCRPEDLWAVIGPSIGPCCYRVGNETAARFGEGPLPYLVPADGGTWRLDLWEANRRHLLAAGLAEGRIAVAGLCTACHHETLFSYRAGRGTTGRMAGLVMLEG
ncbi:MAG: peptidoglycan editing factor PgeF [Thermoanaerobacterales bacterium]|nr:peptidoglycan editing factor PgeF [Bacillota bacterium]MDI6906508.1 peptidoglycan editing factor PgeF [Thermoanaerobacterales bacterium]